MKNVEFTPAMASDFVASIEREWNRADRDMRTALDDFAQTPEDGKVTESRAVYDTYRRIDARITRGLMEATQRLMESATGEPLSELLARMLEDDGAPDEVVDAVRAGNLDLTIGPNGMPAVAIQADEEGNPIVPELPVVGDPDIPGIDVDFVQEPERPKLDGESDG